MTVFIFLCNSLKKKPLNCEYTVIHLSYLIVGFWRQVRLFIVGLFNDYVSVSDYMTDTMMNEFISTWMEVVVAPFQPSSWQFPEGSEKATRTTVRTVSRQAKTEPLITRQPQSTRTRDSAQVSSWCMQFIVVAIHTLWIMKTVALHMAQVPPMEKL